MKSTASGQIILPEFYRARWTDDYKHLLAMVADKYGFSMEYNDHPEIRQDTGVVVLFATPHHMRPDNLMQLAYLDKKIKLIGFMKDIQHYGDDRAEANIKGMFDRYDVILSPAKQLFDEMYPQYVEKAVYFPDFFGPYERFALPFNENPKRKCLLSGAFRWDVYPVRAFVMDNMDGFPVDFVPPPWAGHDIIHDKYARMLNSYLCCVTDSSVFKYTLAKYFEIPATGSLLLANYTQDAKTLGFEPDRHFIDVRTNNVFDVIVDVVEHQEKYEQVRRDGMQFVRENHSIKNRFDQICGVIDAVIN